MTETIREQNAGKALGVIMVLVATVLAYIGFRSPIATLSVTTDEDQLIEADFSLWYYLDGSIQPLLIASALILLILVPRLRGTIVTSWLLIGFSVAIIAGMHFLDTLAMGLLVLQVEAGNTAVDNGELIFGAIQAAAEFRKLDPAYMDQIKVHGVTLGQLDLGKGWNPHGMYLVWFALGYGLYGLAFWLARGEALDLRAAVYAQNSAVDLDEEEG